MGSPHSRCQEESTWREGFGSRDRVRRQPAEARRRDPDLVSLPFLPFCVTLQFLYSLSGVKSRVVPDLSMTFGLLLVVRF